MSQADLLFASFNASTPRIEGAVVPLSDFARGDVGIIERIGDQDGADSSLGHGELERRLLELGFVEGARVELLHEGMFGRDPIAVRLDDMRVALRRREAAQVHIRRTGGRG